MTRPTKGMTLLEVLLAVALLTALTTGTSWLVRTASLRAQTSSRVVAQRAATEALFAAIARDVAIGDADTSATPSTGRGGRVAAAENVLRIATRATPTSGRVGAIVREYSWHRASRELLAVDEPLIRGVGASATPPSARVVLGGVAAFDATIEPKARTLAVSIELDSGEHFHHQWPLP
jgi:prepilin-type N-terminal cleavage/methylation domain-containing protein